MNTYQSSKNTKGFLYSASGYILSLIYDVLQQWLVIGYLELHSFWYQREHNSNAKHVIHIHVVCINDKGTPIGT